MDYDVIIVGLGAMGSAAASFLAARGVKVLGIESHYPAHSLSSSHGDTRLIRLGYFEDPSYVPLLKRAYENWASLQDNLGQQVLVKTGVLQIGTPESKLISGILRSCADYDLPHTNFDLADVRRHYPGFSMQADEVAILDPEGGYLRPELAVNGYIRHAVANGASLLFGEKVVAIEPDSSGVTVATVNGRYRGAKIIVATGPWIAELVPQLRAIVKPIRQVVAWYRPSEQMKTVAAHMPAFISDERENGSLFGFPDIDNNGFKIGRHCHFNEDLDPNRPNSPVTQADTDLIDAFAAQRLTSLDGKRIQQTTCRYTMTPTENFLIDHLPDEERIVIASPCSGHGFKFTSVIGEILADLATTGQTDLPISLFAYDR